MRGKGLKSIVAIEGEHSGRVESYDHNGANVSCENAFGESVRYVSGEIGWVNLDNAFGTLQVYFTEAYLQGGRADVSLDVAFGKTVLYVPSNWKVNLSLDKAFGSIRESGQHEPDGANVLMITGDVDFGSLELVYVGAGV